MHEFERDRRRNPQDSGTFTFVPRLWPQDLVTMRATSKFISACRSGLL